MNISLKRLKLRRKSCTGIEGLWDMGGEVNSKCDIGTLKPESGVEE
jgi:hypothetical protein